MLQGLGFDAEKARTQPLAQLSGGERGRLGLARQLVSAADVLLLDEPTNHLDLETTRWLEEYLRNTDKTILLISHDRAFLANVVDHVLHLEGGSAVAYTGGYEAFVAQRAERRLSQERAFEKQRKVIADEEDYIRRNIAGQNTKQAKGRRKRLSRMPRLSGPTSEEGSAMGLRLDLSERGGDQVAIARDVTIAVEGRTLIKGFTATIQRGEIVGFVGPNGSGKSTFLRALVGEREPAAGELRIGGSVRPSYYRQDMAQVPIDRTLYDVINELRPQWERRMVQGHLARFGFSGDEAQRRAETLSGGERARVALAMMVLTKANFLVLDEPTNHLDVESIEALEDALQEYEGTILLVSHDRAMLRGADNAGMDSSRSTRHRFSRLLCRMGGAEPGARARCDCRSRGAGSTSARKGAKDDQKAGGAGRRQPCRSPGAAAERWRTRREKSPRWKARLRSSLRCSRIRSSTRRVKEPNDRSRLERSSNAAASGKAG